VQGVLTEQANEGATEDALSRTATTTEDQGNLGRYLQRIARRDKKAFLSD